MKRPGWFRPRSYLHFDSPITFEQAEALVTNAVGIASHEFYPFLAYEIVNKKVRRERATGTLREAKKRRTVAYASHRDAHIYAYYTFLLDRSYEMALAKSGLGESVLAFRRLGKSNINFASEAFQRIREVSPCCVIGLDISAFFDNLDHRILKRQWCRILAAPSLPDDHYAVFRSLTRFASVNRDAALSALGVSKHNPRSGNRIRLCTASEFRHVIRGGTLVHTNVSGKGIPQGSALSALLSNTYMLDFDQKLATGIGAIGGHYYRYCDDMLVIVPEGRQADAQSLIDKEIAAVNLAVNPKKTEVRAFKVDGSRLRSAKPLQYLGFLFDGQQILIRSAAFARYSERMRRAVRRAKLTRLKWNNIRFQHGLARKSIYRRALYKKYSHLGRNSFPYYGYRAAEIMDSGAIRRQLKPLWQRLLDEIES